ncbi:MAG: hypothetical protein U5R30_06470 [Deltaproteobacteria bacterium]|nr:hypothetical protein [Deltaproteobacteria bacterium]
MGNGHAWRPCGLRVELLEVVRRVVERQPHMARCHQSAPVVDDGPQDGFVSESICENPLGVDAVLPADHIQALLLEPLDRRGDQRHWRWP